MFFINNIFTNTKYVFNNCIEYNYTLILHVWNFTLSKIKFLPKYYKRNENIWNDGFLFDFLQKKTVDSWIRQYVIFTGFLFSERIVFEAVIRLYNDLLIWPSHNLSLFESENTTAMLNTIIFIYFSLFIFLIILITLFI